MSNETFDFSEALRRMKERKKVKRHDGHLAYGLDDGCILVYGCGTSLIITRMFTDDILATDWEEVKG